LARVALARGHWAPDPAPPRTDGVTQVTALDLPARRIPALARWDRRSFAASLAKFSPAGGWLVVFPSASGKPLDVPPGWRLCWFLIDEFAADNPHFARREAPLLSACDLFVGVSERIVAPRRALVPRAAVLPNGYDERLFRNDAQRPAPDPQILALPAPRLGYVGAITRTKVDVELVLRVARARPRYSIVLVGECPEPHDAERLASLPNVHLLPPRAPHDVAGVVSALDVCFLPYLGTAVNLACSPLKAREALALGVPVVSTPVDELREHPRACFVGADDAELLAHLDAVVAGRLRADPVAVRWFTDATWDVRARQFIALLEDADEPT
jgi:glycosyltransferase involved in cell wall biosynthesis